MVFNHMILLMQAEVERFHAGISLLHDYYQIKVQDVAGDNSVVLVSVIFFSNKYLVCLEVLDMIAVKIIYDQPQIG